MMSKTITGVMVTVAALLLISACESSTSESADSAVIVEFDNDNVTVDEFYLYLEQLNPLMDYTRLPPSEQQRLLDEYVAQRVYADAAIENGLPQRPEVAARLKFFERRVLAEAFRDDFAADIEVADADVRAYYDNNQALFVVPAEYLIEHLVYRTPDRAIHAQAQLREGRPYLELASQRETDTELTFVERNRFAADVILPELLEPVSKLELGEVSELIYTNYGYHVIRLVEKTESGFKPFDEVRGQIKARLQQARAGQRLQAVIDEAVQQGRVATHLKQLRQDGAL